MFNLREAIHAWLARRGYRLSRIEPAIPATVKEHFGGLGARLGPRSKLICFDNETRMQSEVLSAFQEDQIEFSSPLFDPGNGDLMPGSSLPAEPEGRFGVVMDLDAFAVAVLFSRLPWLQRADVLLLRARLGSFWSGNLDLVDLLSRLRAYGFGPSDILDFPQLSTVQSESARVAIAFDRLDRNFKQGRLQRYRTNEAQAYLSAPIVRRPDFELLAGRGSFGFAAGVFNPGAVSVGGRSYLLARGDRTAWAVQKTDEVLFYSSTQPLLLALDDRARISSCSKLTVSGLPNASSSRAEDFRLFKLGGLVFSNHSVMSNPKRPSASHRALSVAEMQTRIGISRLDVKGPTLTWIGFPSLDRPLSQTEKNWAMFANGDKMLLLYSFSPYVLLSCSDWEKMSFTTALEKSFDLPFGGDGMPVRNSVNPVDYDQDHWLHIVHKVYPNKQYSFWAALISKQTLQPVRITKRPLIRGSASHPASIIYSCSVIVSGAEICLFAGMDDSSTAVARIARDLLEAEWSPIAESDRQPSGSP
jgi:predicted GH43/DUF377 family glycosyl hydrolase